ncbi:hypothetical protein GIB67_005214 [Kingdonia uniflora]|uniref:START domain-containing protein n=1 Tax=Kingdonia uniflora TaxID=39325 RepID=A0A7J7NNS7_9MAGN|nr:hypothetical protein GIB67_005214 [Kingdonia uniflora]
MTSQSVESNVFGINKRRMMDTAANAMNELRKIARINNPLWFRSASGDGDILNSEFYGLMYPMMNLFNNPDVRIEGTRDSDFVIMNSRKLVEILLDPIKRRDIFPTIISENEIIEVISSGSMPGSPNGVIQLMYEVLQPVSPLVSSREFYFLRYCVQIEEGLWAIADVSYDFSHENRLSSPSNSRKLPSGCFVKDVHGYSEVTWVEHMEIVERTRTYLPFQDVVYSGMAFGAARWVASLKSILERLYYILMADTSVDYEVTVPSSRGNIIRFSIDMLACFCKSIRSSRARQWIRSYDTNDVAIRLRINSSPQTGQHNGYVLSAVTSIRLPLSSESVFNIFKDGANCPRLLRNAIFSNDILHKIAHIINGEHLGDFISVFQHFSNGQANSNLTLQESWQDRSGALVVYTPIDRQSMFQIENAENTSSIELLPCGVSIIPDGKPIRGASTGGGGVIDSAGSLLTVAYQIPLSSMEEDVCVAVASNIIESCVHRIRIAFNCTGP